MPSSRFWLVLGAVMAGAAVGLGAVRSHWAEQNLGPEEFTAFGRALEQHTLAAVGLLVLGLLDRRVRRPFGLLAGTALVGGLLLFCTAVYLDAAGLLDGANAAAPYGGVLLMAAWVLLAVGVLVAPRSGQ